jgi:hypothetical protein
MEKGLKESQIILHIWINTYNSDVTVYSSKNNVVNFFIVQREIREEWFTEFRGWNLVKFI